MFGKKGQVATEYIVLTGFILIIVTLGFTYSFVTNTQNIKVSQANTALDKMANAADLVYALGPDNVKYIEIVLPRDISVIQDLVVCGDLDQGHNLDCSGEKGGLKIGAIEMQLSMLGSSTSIRRPIRTEVELDRDGEMTILAGRHIMKVYWCEEKICIERA